ncbi:uncharacterized protein [Clytia hemisphaerica]|uniref:uncharacterized protein n=1 Tax=Clytia hemisphaerica TaxID=252671 RepID=UPI0034D46192
MLVKAHRAYEKSICDKSKEKLKIFWSHVRSKLKSTSGVSPLLQNPDDKSSLKHDDHEKANILQKQFFSVFTDEPEGELPDFPASTDKKISDLFVTDEMMKKQIKLIDTNKSFGPDEIHPKMLVELVDHVAEPLAILMNKTLSCGIIPKNGRWLTFRPIYKNKVLKI